MLEFRELKDPGALRACEGVQQEVWGGSALETIPASQLKAAVHAGGLVAGALQAGELLGFVFGFPSHTPAAGVGHHSHLLAVHPRARGQGVGRALKWFQRSWCLERGVSVVTWTFDPLLAQNARLNLEHLGASAGRYYPDFYSSLDDTLNGALPSDRLLAEWSLTAPHVAVLAESRPRVNVNEGGATLLEPGAHGEPRQTHAAGKNGRNAQAVRLELPRRIDLQNDPEGALEWRLALRQTMTPLLDAGYRVVRFMNHGYLLERPVAEPAA